MRLLTYLQKADGLSRRRIWELFQHGNVFIDGEIVEDLQQDVEIGIELLVKERGKELVARKVDSLPTINPTIVSFYKPKGLVVSKDDKHNKTIFEILPDSWQKDFYYI